MIFSSCGTALDWNTWAEILGTSAAFRAAPEQCQGSSPSVKAHCHDVLHKALPVYLFFFNTWHSCWIFRLSCLPNHLSEWKIWEVNKFLSRHLPPLCGLSLSLNKAVTASGEIGVLLWCTGHPQVLNTDLYMLQRCYFTCCIYHVTGIMRLSSVLFSMVFCVKSFYKIIIKSCKVAFRRKKQKPKNQIKVWLRASQ